MLPQGREENHRQEGLLADSARVDIEGPLL